MLTFFKDLLSFLVLGGFTATALGWMDVASRLV